MDKLTFYAHGSNSDPYSKYQCPINLAAILTGTVAELDEALYYMFMYMPTEVTSENYSAEKLNEDLQRVNKVIDRILETKKPLLPSKLYSEVKELRITLFEVLFELFIYDAYGTRLDAYVDIPEDAKRNQLHRFLDKMRVPKLSSMKNKFKKYMYPFVFNYYFGSEDVKFCTDSDSVTYSMNNESVSVSPEELKVIIKFN